MAKETSNDIKPTTIKEKTKVCPFIRVCNKNTTTGATSGAETAYLSGEIELTSVFNGVPVAQAVLIYNQSVIVSIKDMKLIVLV